MDIRPHLIWLSWLLGCTRAVAPADPTAAEGASHAPPQAAAHHGAHHGASWRFEDPELWSKRWDDPSRDAWQRPAEVVALLALAPGMAVADLGTGTGYFVPHLARAVGPEGQVWALDIEPAMVRHVTERAAREGFGNVRAAQVSPSDPGLAAHPVDRVLIVNTWHHLSDRVDYAERLRAGLKPGGLIVVVDFSLDAAHGPPHEERLPPETIRSELAAAGLRASIAEEGLPDQVVVLGQRP